jgi:TolA-binding protein
MSVPKNRVWPAKNDAGSWQLVAIEPGAQHNFRMRWLALVLLLLSPVFSAAAEPGEVETFAAAAKASTDGFHERADTAWAEFLAKYPKSDRATEAALAQAQARHQLKRFPAALEILDARLPQAGALTDQYRFWRAQTLLDAGNFPAAETAAAELLAAHVDSPLRLNATIAQAQARFARENFPGVVELLAPTNSIFQQATATSTNLPAIARGYLLLAEGQLRAGNVDAARASLQALAARALPPELGWERWQLLARVEMAGSDPAQAVAPLTNALAQARAAGKPALQAQTLHLQADLYKRLNQPPQIVQSYEAIIAAENMPPEQKRLALLKEVEFFASQAAFTNAATRLQLYLTQNAQAPDADLLTIKAGEYALEAYRQQTNKVAGLATNLIADARGFFDAAIQRYTNSALLGKAYLGRGWALWEENRATGNGQRLVESQAAFQAAAEKLPPGEAQSEARFKLGDTQFQMSLFSAAGTNYQAIIHAFAPGNPAMSNLVAQAAEQLIRCYLAQTNIAGAEELLQKTVALFPETSGSQSAWLLTGQTAAELGFIEKARAILKDFPAKFPSAPLRTEAELAYARTFALEEKWPEAIDNYSRWTAANPAHPSAAQAEFDRASFYDRSGQATNAFNLFTNFVTRFSTNILAARAQDWIGNYYFNLELWPLAEQSYQRIFQSTNWDAQELSCQARMMAARTAYYRQGYPDARGYLTNLLNATCSPEITAQAWFLLGDVLIEQRPAANALAATNAFENFNDALSAFKRITLLGATNRFEPLAWGKMGDCYFQLGAIDPASYEKATNAYQRVLDSKRADLPVLVRNQAEVGIGLALEKMAELRPKERTELLKAALNRHLNVVYGVAGKPAPHWQMRAALAAGRLTEALNQNAPQNARDYYTRLIDEIPSMKQRWQAKIAALNAGAPSEKAP